MEIKVLFLLGFALVISGFVVDYVWDVNGLYAALLGCTFMILDKMSEVNYTMIVEPEAEVEDGDET